MGDRLADLYPTHVQTLKQRHDRALGDSGFDHAIIFAGAIRVAFLDDMFYPFKPNPHFKAWLRLSITRIATSSTRRARSRVSSTFNRSTTGTSRPRRHPGTGSISSTSRSSGIRLTRSNTF